ncbi:MAG: MBL fold metallo-hydrolase [Beijerinckiaceae bacterium]
MSLSATILGCGSSGGVPRPGQGWGACDPENPKNRRRRCSLLVERPSAQGSTIVLVDTSPDLREQWLATGPRRAGHGHLDGILMTHAHADHTHGMDDVRPLVIKARKRIDIFMDAPTEAAVRMRFGYIFETPPGSQYPPLLTLRSLHPGVAVRIEGAGGAVDAIPFLLDHGDISALGFRFGNLAYTPDVVAIPDDSVEYLAGLDTWIIDALRYTRHPSHFSLEESLAWIDRMKPRRAILTNLHTDMDYAQLAAELPDNVEPAYDGMEVSVDL